MRKLTLGIVAAATLLTAVPAMAQVGFYASPGGVGVQFGPTYGYGYYHRPYYDYYGGPGVYRFGHPWHNHWRYHHHHWDR